MNAAQNSEDSNQEMVKNSSSQIETTTNAPQNDKNGAGNKIFLDLLDSFQRAANGSNVEYVQGNKSNEQPEPPSKQSINKTLDEIDIGSDNKNTTTATPNTTTSNSNENPMQIEENSLTDQNITTVTPLIPTATVEPSIKQSEDASQQKIVIRYAHSVKSEKNIMAICWNSMKKK